MKLRVSGRARVCIREQDEWWRTHRRDAPDLFKQELVIAFERILRAPKVRRPYNEIDGEPVWRVLMPRTEQHVYFTVDDAAAEVMIEMIWGARRGRAPKRQRRSDGLLVAVPGRLTVRLRTLVSALASAMRNIMLDPFQTRVEQIMEREVYCASAKWTLIELQQALIEHRINGAPVVERGQLVGVVSRSDVLKHSEVERTLSGMAADHYRSFDGIAGAGTLSKEQVHDLNAAELERLSRVLVEEVMTREILGIGPRASVAEAAERLVAGHVDRLVVQHEGEVRGLLTSRDIVRWVADASR